jgi:hypothetical protein
MKYKKKHTNTIMIIRINTVRDVTMGTLNLKKKNKIIMDMTMVMVTDTAMEAMDMPDMTMRI